MGLEWIGKGYGDGNGKGEKEAKNLGKIEKNEKSNAGGSSKNQVGLEAITPENGRFFDKSDWLTTKEAAVYLRKFSRDGVPSENAVHKLVSKGSIRRRKFGGRLFFRKNELNFLIDSSVA